MYKTDCRSFNGYKPCSVSETCLNCLSYKPIRQRVVLIHLGALGAVVRSTSLLQAIHRKYPQCHLTWITEKPADKILQNHPLIDKVSTVERSDLSEIKYFNYQAVFVIDKSTKAVSIASELKYVEYYGFKMDSLSGAIIPANDHAYELWELGLNNQKKFYHNKKSEVQLQIEALDLNYQKLPEYDLPLMSIEANLLKIRKSEFKIDLRQPTIGINTGCADTIPYKKWTVEYHRKVITELLAKGFKNIVLLGGPEDIERNQKIAQGLPVILSPMDQGLRDGLVSVAACDIVITGDSLGMHMAISQKKFVVAWFGPTVSQEIELYGRGVKLNSPLSCSPCWKRICTKTEMCYDQIDLSQVIRAVKMGVEKWKSTQLSCKPHSWEISS